MGMTVAVIDVGSNTVRLLVARWNAGELVEVERAGTRLGLGAEIERHGKIPQTKVAAAAKAVRKLSALARKHGAETVEVVVTAPGRQSGNGEELVAACERAARAPVRVLSPEEEGRFAFFGAISSAPPLPATVAVCDVGGASTELAVGRPEGEPAWLRSVDLGAVRITERFFGDGRDEAARAAAREEIAQAFRPVIPPLPAAALAAGGTARALRKLVGPTLGPVELAEAERLLATSPYDELADEYKIDLPRVEILLGGALVLAEVQRRVAVPLTVTRGGLREGVALEQARLAAA